MTRLDHQFAYWDAVADSKAFVLPVDCARLEPLVPFTGRVLDYGCGYGRTVHALREHGWRRVVGVDPSPRMIERGRRENPDFDLRILESARLPFGAEAFDAALMLAVLTCIPTDAGQRAAVAEVSRVLRPGGILYLSDFPLQADARNRERYEQFADKYGVHGVFELPEGVVLRHHDMQWIEKLLAGFERIDQFEIDAMTMNNNPAKAFQWIGRKRR